MKAVPLVPGEKYLVVFNGMLVIIYATNAAEAICSFLRACQCFNN